jgi:hypothetical protein
MKFSMVYDKTPDLSFTYFIFSKQIFPLKDLPDLYRFLVKQKVKQKNPLHTIAVLGMGAEVLSYARFSKFGICFLINREEKMCLPIQFYMR